jgi:hypothetical protein
MKTLLRFKILEPARNLIADLLVWFSDTDNCRAVRRPPLRDTAIIRRQPERKLGVYYFDGDQFSELPSSGLCYSR